MGAMNPIQPSRSRSPSYWRGQHVVVEVEQLGGISAEHSCHGVVVECCGCGELSLSSLEPLKGMC